jgi:hypothetical protein
MSQHAMHSDTTPSSDSAVLFSSNGNSYTVSAQLDMCIYRHILRNMETLVGQNK